MTTISLGGSPFDTSGALPENGSAAPGFESVGADSIADEPDYEAALG